MKDDYSHPANAEGSSIEPRFVETDQSRDDAGSVATGTTVVETSITFLDGNETPLASAVVPHASGASLSLQTRQQSISSASAPVHSVVDASTDDRYLDIQYTYDGEDGYPRQNLVEFPNDPARKETKKLHAPADTIVASGSCVGIASTTIEDWPDIA